MLGVERLRRVLGRLAAHHLVPPHVAAVGPGDLVLAALDDEHVRDVRLALAEGLVDGRLQRRHRAAAVAAVGGDDQLRVGVGDPVDERLRREPAEHDAVRRADPGAGQHRHYRLGDHRQVDRDPVALVHAEFGQRVGRLAHLVEQLGVGDRAGVARLALEVDRHLIAVPVGHMPVQAVHRCVERPADEPLRERRVPLQRLRPARVPLQPVRLTLPEGQPVGRCRFVRVRADVRGRGEFGTRLETPLLVQQIRQGFVRHGVDLTVVDGHLFAP